ncbi:RING-type domain-containing protein [Heracleum sosnowskyi]|uniref:RING-type E3 ubiquitin transferase n=1 Tax=Heracleum sosnowskyi TaxID=360622 RepID=A0AAD8M3P0_9APIA|nr:RING-type domain-containing protein [Heracleum sosnowskyi]
MTNVFYNVYYDPWNHQVQLTRTTIHPFIHSPMLHHSVQLSGGFHDPQEYILLYEQIGAVDYRLSGETIMEHVNITSYDASKRMDEEAEICVICQAEYEKDELIGVLRCQHEFHVECIKRWLQQHDSCAICKAAAISPIANW